MCIFYTCLCSCRKPVYILYMSLLLSEAGVNSKHILESVPAVPNARRDQFVRATPVIGPVVMAWHVAPETRRGDAAVRACSANAVLRVPVAIDCTWETRCVSALVRCRPTRAHGSAAHRLARKVAARRPLKMPVHARGVTRGIGQYVGAACVSRCRVHSGHPRLPSGRFPIATHGPARRQHSTR